MALALQMSSCLHFVCHKVLERSGEVSKTLEKIVATLKPYCKREHYSFHKRFLGLFFSLFPLGSVLNCGPQAVLCRELSSAGKSVPEEDLTDRLQ